MSDNNSSTEGIGLLLTLLFTVIGYLVTLKSQKKAQKATASVTFPPLPEEEEEEEEQEVGYYTIHENYTTPDYYSPKRKVETTLSPESAPEATGEEEFDLKKAIIYSEILNRKYD